MSFIELTERDTRGVTVNTAHILTISTEVFNGEACTSISLAGGSQYAPGRVLVTESYAEVVSKVNA